MQEGFRSHVSPLTQTTPLALVFMSHPYCILDAARGFLPFVCAGRPGSLGCRALDCVIPLLCENLETHHVFTGSRRLNIASKASVVFRGMYETIPRQRDHSKRENPRFMYFIK